MTSRAGAVVGGLAIAFIVLSIANIVNAQEKVARRALPFFGAQNVDAVLDNPRGLQRESPPERRSGSGLDAIKTICGPTTDWMDVELYDGRFGTTVQFVNARQGAVAQIQWRPDLNSVFAGQRNDPGNVEGIRWCTGTLVANNLFLTAAHCLQPQTEGWRTPARKVDSGGKVSLEPLPAADLAPLMQLNFNYQVSANDPQRRIRQADTYPIVRLVEYGFEMPGSLDYAVIEAGPGTDGKLPGETYPVTAFDVSDGALARAQMLTLIQHPHGQPKKIMAGPKIGNEGNLLLYSDLDTLGGSSGSGVLSEDGKIIGVHTNGGCTSFGGANRGVTLKAIRAVSAVLR
jgi:hypothetical protein